VAYTSDGDIAVKATPLLLRAAAFASLAVVGCSSRAQPSASPPPAGDAGSPVDPQTGGGNPPCEGDGGYDAGAYVQHASCTVSGADGGAIVSCAEWLQDAQGDWESFLTQCDSWNGQPSTQPCPSAGQVATCFGAATCATQMITHYYDATTAAGARAGCSATAGAAWVVP
jgi:hypothetical protein